jgi:hypothetical protein
LLALHPETFHRYLLFQIRVTLPINIFIYFIAFIYSIPSYLLALPRFIPYLLFSSDIETGYSCRNKESKTPESVAYKSNSKNFHKSNEELCSFKGKIRKNSLPYSMFMLEKLTFVALFRHSFRCLNYLSFFGAPIEAITLIMMRFHEGFKYIIFNFEPIR